MQTEQKVRHTLRVQSSNTCHLWQAMDVLRELACQAALLLHLQGTGRQASKPLNSARHYRMHCWRILLQATFAKGRPFRPRFHKRQAQRTRCRHLSRCRNENLEVDLRWDATPYAHSLCSFVSERPDTATTRSSTSLESTRFNRSSDMSRTWQADVAVSGMA